MGLRAPLALPRCMLPRVTNARPQPLGRGVSRHHHAQALPVTRTRRPCNPHANATLFVDDSVHLGGDCSPWECWESVRAAVDHAALWGVGEWEGRCCAWCELGPGARLGPRGPLSQASWYGHWHEMSVARRSGSGAVLSGACFPVRSVLPAVQAPSPPAALLPGRWYGVWGFVLGEVCVCAGGEEKARG